MDPRTVDPAIRSSRAATPHEAAGPRLALVLLSAFVALTAAAGGIALTVGALIPSTATMLSPPDEYLAGSPFTSYLIPGLALLIVVGGSQVVVLLLQLRRSTWRHLVTAASAFAILVWIFIQMIIIPFSPLQAVYFLFGLAEAGFVLLDLGVARVGRRQSSM